MVRRKRKGKGPHCYKCGSPMNKVTIKLGEISVRAWRCKKDGEEVIHPEDAQKALLLNKLKKEGIKLKIGILNKAPYLRFPKEFKELIKKGDEVTVKVISGNLIELILNPS
jgi:hypothetical protein